MYFDENKSEQGHSRRALRSGAVTLVARVINAVIQIGSVLFLARLLTPEDYGLVGMVTAITGFAPVLVDLGSRDAIVQRANIRRPEVSALFWITQAVGLGCALLVAGSGPLIARFYGEPRLTLIAVVASLGFITSALMAQHYALLRRAMKFREIGIIEVAANVTAAVLAVGLALEGFHYWALVIRPVAATALVAVGSWIACRWAPGRPLFNGEVSSMVRFGLNVTGFTMADFAGKSADRVAIGYRSGAASLGYYQNALFVYENLIDIVVSPLHGVAVAGLSKLRSDHQELRRTWAKALSTLAFYSAPAFGLLAVTSPDLIAVLLGPKWAYSGAILSILALRGIPHTIERTCGWLHVTAGRTDRWARWGAFLAVMQFGALLVGLQFGPVGVATAYAILMAVLFVPALAYAGKPLQIGASDVVLAVWRQVTGAIVSVLVGFALRELIGGPQVSVVVRTAVIVLAYSACYFAIVVGLLRLHTPLTTMASLVRDVQLRRASAPLPSSASTLL